MQLLQSITLESFDGEYSDSKSDELNNVIANIENEEGASDLDDEYTNQEAPINTDDGARTRSSSDIDEQTLLGKTDSTAVHSQTTALSSLPNHCRTTKPHNIVRIRARHHTRQSSFFVTLSF